jgi:hypothetical protein
MTRNLQKSPRPLHSDQVSIGRLAHEMMRLSPRVVTASLLCDIHTGNFDSSLNTGALQPVVCINVLLSLDGFTAPCSTCHTRTLLENDIHQLDTIMGYAWRLFPVQHTAFCGQIC